MTTIASERLVIEGTVAPGWEPVRDAFVENFRSRGEVGGACAVYQHGEKVVDLWGGVRDAATGAPWEEDTMVLVYSTTKGLAAMTLALAHSRGWLDYDERVATYRPEFAQAGKERTTVRQLLAHQAGLFGFDEKVDQDVIADLDRLAGVMARQRPAWEPGERQAYHAISLGFYEGEILRRVDPQHRTLGRFFADEIAGPLGEEFYIRLPEGIPDERLAPDDACMRGPVQFSLGFMKPTPDWPFGHEGAFGSPGAGGSLGYADPATGIGYAHETNRMGGFDGDPRDVALRRAIALLSPVAA